MYFYLHVANKSINKCFTVGNTAQPFFSPITTYQIMNQNDPIFSICKGKDDFCLETNRNIKIPITIIVSFWEFLLTLVLISLDYVQSDHNLRKTCLKQK